MKYIRTISGIAKAEKENDKIKGLKIGMKNIGKRREKGGEGKRERLEFRSVPCGRTRWSREFRRKFDARPGAGALRVIRDRCARERS